MLSSASSSFTLPLATRLRTHPPTVGAAAATRHAASTASSDHGENGIK